MPEIAECRRYVDQLNAVFCGKNLNEITIVGGRFVKEGIPGLQKLQDNLPHRLIRFNTKGKFIYGSFGNDVHMFITLGMAASFGKQNKHSAVKFNFENGEIYYNDIRHFGTIKVVFTKEELDKKLNSLGWDALQNPTIPDNIYKQVSKQKSKEIAEVLLNQKIFAGVGNYIRSEVLYRAGIAPYRLASALSEQEVADLCQHIIDVASEAYSSGGATIATYSDMYGIAGDFYKRFKVYDQKQDPLGNPVLRFTAGDGRTVHWVKEVQK